jgi:hypothetical protein
MGSSSRLMQPSRARAPTRGYGATRTLNRRMLLIHRGAWKGFSANFACRDSRQY